MLEEIKQIYEENASIIPGWRKIGRSELCRRYLYCKDIGSSKAENYLSAIICHFWNVINHNYHSQQGKIATPQDCYEWVVDSILYALDKHVWTDPNNSLYGDPNAPEKSINVCIVSTRANFYVAQNRNKRKVALESVSLDKLTDELSDAYFLPYYDKTDMLKDYLVNKVKVYFNQKQYLEAFILHCIITYDFILTTEENGIGYQSFNYSELKKFLRKWDHTECVYFSYIYGFNVDIVEKAATYLYNYSYDQIGRKLTKFLQELRRDKAFIKALKGN